MTKKNYSFWFFFLFIFLLKGQTNLVPNPSFDNHTACPTITGQYHLCTNWLNCNGNIGVGLWGTPDYYHACGTFNATYNPIPPNTAQGVCNTHTGGGMMGLVCYNTPYPDYREYLSAQLTCPMVPGNTYTVSFWINAGTSPKVKYNTSHFGVYLSNTMPVQSGYLPILVTPQYEITSTISNTTWVKHTFTVNPVSNLNWITLGCFRTDAILSVSLATPSAPYPYSNYFVDDIEVLSPSVAIPVNIATQSVSCNSNNNGSATVTPVSGTYSYTWLPGNQNTASVNNLSSGIYTVIVGGACGSDTKTISIGQQPSPTVTIANSSLSVCPNSTVAISPAVSGGTPGYNYLWSIPGITTPSVSVNPSMNTVYSCTVTDSQGCKGSASASVTINNVTSNFSYSFDQCSGLLTTTNTSSGATSYHWDFGNGNTSNITSPSQLYSNPGNYSVQLVAINSSCSDTTEQSIVINSTSQSSFNYTTALCDSSVLLSNSSVGATSFLWDFGDGSTSTLSDPGIHIYHGNSNYTVTLITNPGTLCADTSSHSFTITKSSLAQFNVSSSACSQSIAVINTSSLATTYQWDFGDGFTSTAISPQHSYSATGNFIVTLITNSGTTCADTAHLPVSINPFPAPAFNYSVDICTGAVTFTNTSQNAFTYYWNFGDGHSSVETNPVNTYSTSGNYTVSLTAEPSLTCAISTSQPVTLNLSIVKADFSFDNPEFTYDILFNNLSVNGVSFQWDFGDGTNSNVFEPIHTYAHIGEQNVCMEAMNAYGCKDLICKTIKVDADWTLYVPNTFTPNDDDKNDVFYAYGSNLNSFKMMIFDRWGEQLFFSDDQLKGWDGTYEGKPVPEGVYVWKILAVDMYRKSHERSGHVTLIK